MDTPKSFKKYLMYFIMLMMVVATPVVLLGGFFLYRKMTYSYDYCNAYGEIDQTLGWRLKSRADSCLSLKNHLSGFVYFDSTIFTNDLGFRSAAPAGAVTPGGVAVVGDSWTFGYGVNHDQTYPAQLASRIGQPVENLGIPAYGTGQALLLLERHLPVLKPGIVVHLNLGLWKRNLCMSWTRPRDQLVPCYWWNGESVSLVLPEGDLVLAKAREHIYASGMLTSGYDPLSYWLFIKPREVLDRVKDWLPQTASAPAEPPLPLLDRTILFRVILDQLFDMAENANFKVVLIDPDEEFARNVAEMDSRAGERLLYIGRSDWNQFVEVPASTLSPAEARVPGDGHFGGGTNRLIADLVARRLGERGWAKVKPAEH